jgi:glycolate oxidase FAD binding subunit
MSRYPITVLAPSTPAELAQTLLEAAGRGQTISLGGNASKRGMAGPMEPADVELSTICLRSVLQYEPRDLTISVEAGLTWRELTHLLAENRQMVPLDPPFAGDATVGGVIAANSSGPRRRLYGTARDLVIGMRFATLEGKVVETGGMVVKNVAGLDMAKLMIGSFGTLGAIASVNFKLTPMPEMSRTFLPAFDTLAAAMAARDAILKGQLQPAAIDLLNPAAAALLGYKPWLLAICAAGSANAVERYRREFAGAPMLEGDVHHDFWRQVTEFTPRFLQRHADGAVVRASCTLKEVDVVMRAFEGPAVARAGTGVCYGYFESSAAAGAWFAGPAQMRWKSVIEFSPEARKHELELWPWAGSDFEIMKRVKHLFDPGNLLNRGRLYRRI